MLSALILLHRSLSFLWLLFFSWFALTSYREREPRATYLSLIIGVVGSGLLLLLSSTNSTTQTISGALILGIILLFFVLFILPIGSRKEAVQIPIDRVDERTIMFARARLKPGTPEYEEYYRRYPEQEESDARTRNKAGLLADDSNFANHYMFASAHSSFMVTHALRNTVEGNPRKEPVVPGTHETRTTFLKELARFFGALDVGITQLHSYHIYSHVGRGSGNYGEEITLDHKYAIAITVEMDFDMVGSAPHSPIVMESAKQYVESSRVAVQLAEAIRQLGFDARAHIDGNYRVIAPLVARDAGLGEIGRMGLLMTPTHGPRVRLAVVTTNMDLIPNHYTPDNSVIDFCTKCKKCATSCPSKSLPDGDRMLDNGALRWMLNPDTCFAYWNVIGTDCGKCMAVCPYSHPNAFPHNVVRWGIARSGFFRRFALLMDDFFYGKAPPTKTNPDWLLPIT